MRKHFLVGIFIVSVLSGGCATNSENQNMQIQTTVNPAKNSAVGEKSPAPPNAQTPAKSIEELEKISREAFNSNSSKATVQNVPVQNKSKSDDSLASRSAPDNSTFSSMINQKGQPVEVRTFKDNPQIIKVERIFVTTGQKIIKVYLKNGQTVELKNEQLPDFAVASVSAILNAAQAADDK